MKLAVLCAFALAFLFLIAPSPSLASTIGRVTANNLGLVGYWTFDGPDLKQNVTDRSGQGNIGYLVGFTSTTTVAGKIGQALRFDGSDDQIYVSDQDLLDFDTGDFTLSAWIKTRTTATGGAYRLITKRLGGVGWETYIEGGSNTLHMFIGDTDSFEFASLSSTNIRDTNWHHVVVVFDRDGNATGYVDGNMGGTPRNIAGESGSIATTHALEMGRGDFGHLFDGSIDDVRVYNRALSATEVAALYKSGSANAGRTASGTNAPLTNGLVGYWTFDGGAIDWRTNTTRDLSGNNNTGTLISMSTTSSGVAGKIGQALSKFGTANFVSMNSPTGLDNIDLQGGGGMSLAAWIYPISAGGLNTGRIMQKGTSAVGTADGDWAFYLGSSNLPLRFEKSFDNTILAVLSADNVISLNRWQYVAMSWDGSANASNVHFYVNGKEVSYQTQQNGIGNKQTDEFNNFSVGSDNNFLRGFNGSIDDVRVYNRALSPQEVQELYKIGAAKVGHTASGPNAPLTSGLVGHWSFDGPATHWETGKTDDKSGQGNHGQLINMSTTSSGVAGKIGQALRFSAGPQVSITSGPALASQNAFSYSAWVKNNSATLSDQQGIFALSSAHFAFAVGADNSLFAWITNDVGFHPSAATAGFSDWDKWHHVVATYDGARVILFRDGMQVVASGAESGAVPASNSFDIGGHDSGAQYRWNGSIDDVRIYNRALSAQEIQQLYLMGK